MVGQPGFFASPAKRERRTDHVAGNVYFTTMLGTGGASMLGAMRKPTCGGWL